MAAAALSPLVSSVEKTNGAKLSRLLIDGGTTVLRKIFDGHHPPANLITDLNANYPILNNLLRRRVLNGHLWDKLFPPGGVAPDSKTFDITLLFVLLTNICGLTPPPSGWHTEPLPSDTSREANLARVKLYRNVLYGHVGTTGVDTRAFSALWTEISGVLVRLGLGQAEVDRLKAEKGGEQDYIDVLKGWADSEKDIKSQLEDIHQKQDETQKSVEKLFQAVEGVRYRVECLVEKSDKDIADEVFQKLAKCEFRGDIEYYLQRFQEGTREWVFDRVQNWLDDRSSQNRVMVISGNAGMGKSVIAAVVCKRTQETRRLLGSHFCQHNNARYSNPQLMIQSLACHLFHTLPGYKQALEKQLSRNLGTELNNMGVVELFALLFKEPLDAVVDPGISMLMVIDGLDESEYQGRNELLDVIANQFCKLPNWIRFIVTTRPASTIVEKLRQLKPLELQSDDEKNLEDIRVFFQMGLQHVIKPDIFDEFLERLVSKSEGLMLYAHFLSLSISKNVSVLIENDLKNSLPTDISSVYLLYFKRLETELKTNLEIKEEHFLNLLSAITASREPLPVGFVSRVLAPGTNSPPAKRRVQRALGSVSALLPIRDDCLHVIHKSVRDWLTNSSCYGEHEFIMDEIEGHRILTDLCTEELDDVKREGVNNVKLTATKMYALNHGARHIFHVGVKREALELERLTNSYIVDLEIVYAKTCINSTVMVEDLLWLRKQGTSKLPLDCQSTLDILLFLLRKHHRLLTYYPQTFLQTMLNEGGKVLSDQALNLLRHKYPEIPYMEDVHKKKQLGGILARFECSSAVICLDVSPQLDYMVCECTNGMLQLWSLLTSRLEWTSPVVIGKSYNMDSLLPSRRFPCSLYRSVVFHPTKTLVLPGILSQAYTMAGVLKPLFPGSKCRFSVCSISGDKTKILTDCLESSKCLVLWSLENGCEIDRIPRDEEILSFALSRDERLLAISHPSGLICLVDAKHGFRELAQTANPGVCGMLKFSPDQRFLFCCYDKELEVRLSRLSVCKEPLDTFSLDGSFNDVNFDVENFESFNDRGFSFGDLIDADLPHARMMFVLDEQRLLRCSNKQIEMMDIKDVNKSSQGKAAKATEVALSFDGQTVYVASETSITALEVLTGKHKSSIELGVMRRCLLCPVGRGVLISKRESIVELWDHDLYACIKKWTNLPGVKQLILLSEEQVAVVTQCEVKFLGASSGEIMSTIPVFQGKVLACNKKRQLVTISNSFDTLQLLDGSKVVWKKEKDDRVKKSNPVRAVFSPMEHLLVVSTVDLLVLNAKTGNTLRTFPPFSLFNHCNFISEKECIIPRSDLTVQMFNIESGKLLTSFDVESEVTCLAVCSFELGLVAIGLKSATPNFKVIRVNLPQSDKRR